MKKIIVLIIMNLFIFNGVGNAAIDCTNPEKMSEKLKCKMSDFKKNKEVKDNDGKESKFFRFKNPFQKLNDWGKRNKTLSGIVNK
ncbi:hypothetical protein OAS84_02540 [Candidatus Pelagibacter sp.]|nr:hypothetical protein [Candidatus Pelagibacter sp.]